MLIHFFCISSIAPASDARLLRATLTRAVHSIWPTMITHCAGKPKYQLSKPMYLLKKKEKLLYLGEVLEGDRLVNTPFKIGFKEDKPDEKLCAKEISAKQHKLLKHAIENDYYFQMFFDHLPLWGFIGKVSQASGLKILTSPAPANSFCGTRSRPAGTGDKRR